MADKCKSKIFYCPLKKRDVEITYSLSGSWFNSKYTVKSCPAMYDGGTACNRQCVKLLGLSTIFPTVALFRF